MGSYMATSSKSGFSKLIILLVLAVGAGVTIWWLSKDNTEDKPKYQSVGVVRGDIIQAVTATGTLNPVLNVQVGSQISGNIQKLYADFNSKVKAGQLIAQLDAASYKARVEQTTADVANAKAALQLAQINARRAADLFKDRLISQSEYDTAVAGLAQAEALLQTREASMNSAKVDLDRCSIFSPVDGIVIDRKVDVGQTVAASMNAPVLFQIANDLTKMQIDANVSEADVGGVVEGQEVTFTVDAFPGRTFNGKVVQVRNSPITVQNVVTYDTVIEVSNAELKLKPGMTANVSIITAKKEGVLKIPNSSLRFKPPEPTTNLTFVTKMLTSVGLGKKPAPAATNVVAKVETDTNAAPAIVITGDEPGDVLFKKMRELREAGGEMTEAARARFRERIASGELKRPEGSGGPGGGGSRSGSGGSRYAGPVSRTVYLLSTNTVSSQDEPVIEPKAARVKLGISDGATTEVIDGLKEGDNVITAVKLPQASGATAAAPSSGGSPFGSPFGRGPR